MAVWGRSPLLVAAPLWMCFGSAAASLPEPYVCYVLDGILFLYGLILTALYCKIKFYGAKPAGPATGKPKQNAEEGIYTGLTPHAQDTYETIGMKK
ncbi:high affinity immunoglobulin epsilon receptor subunit gamma isoform X1 [Hippoglossus hippoglossus]|uniref:high affinity immunoglobulin epsilon receptor subunit gamma isoform X1 n=1 Tax=Hippoglossus hippoglossus TaxID=8267 RepID=UPI00148E38DA|nr:high affinity immunoglobulin epsilon receptor subunit gamma isoform X1 [Hippoglossus hippoglossus]XP_035004611.1 high affinity immunoglobulin epsilon receptor subunit gamma isoform X2 [Hippoglossus stenolepis]